jgi:hypothetical protein
MSIVRIRFLSLQFQALSVPPPRGSASHHGFKIASSPPLLCYSKARCPRESAK